MVFDWSLSDSKSPQVCWTLPSILAVLDIVVVWKVPTRPSTSKSSSPFNNPLVTVPKAPITIGIIFTFMFHSFFQFPSKVEVLVLFFNFLSVLFYGQPGQQSRQFCKFSISLFLIIIRSGLLAEILVIRLYVKVSPIGVYVCHFLGQVLGCAYTICLYGQI